MIPASHAFGREAEAAAAEALRRKGYRIVERNLRLPGGELDLVAELGTLVVFVEVKARRSEAFGGAVSAVDGRKQTKLIKLAAQYVARRSLQGRPCRFDVVVCSGSPDRRMTVQHIEHAFEVPGDRLEW